MRGRAYNDIKKARGEEYNNEYYEKVSWGFTGFWKASRDTRPRISPRAGRVMSTKVKFDTY